MTVGVVHVPEALHVWPARHDPQELPQTSSTPQVRAPHAGVHPAEMHVPKLHTRPPEHEPQELP